MCYTQGVWVWNESVHDNFRLSSNSNTRTMADQWQAETSTCPVDLLQQFAHGLCHRRGKVCWWEHTGTARGTGVPCWCCVRRQLLAVSIQTWPVEHVWNKNIMVTELWCNQWTHLKQKHYSHRVTMQPVEHIWGKNITVTELWCNQWNTLTQSKLFTDPFSTLAT